MKQSARQAMPSLSRRTFVTAAAATGAAAAVGLSGCAPKAEDKPAEQGPAAGEDPFADCELVYGCCSPECQHHLLKGYVRDGKLVKVESGEVNECPACGKGFARVEMCNSDKRLTKPLKLVGAKGSGEFEEISWDEAIDLIEEKINYALDNGGSQSIIVQGGSGNFSSLNGAMGTLGSWLGGTTPTSGNMCCAGIDAGVSTILGTRSQPTRNEFENSDYIIAWGNNPVVANSDGTLGHWIVESMKRGSKLIVMDPMLTWVAGKADVFLQVRPGTDAALALALCNVIIEEGLEDKEFVDLWCYGYDEFKEHVKKYTAAFAAETCGVDEELIVEAARKIGKAKSACLQWGVAMDHTSEGFITGMACFDLMALTGNFEKPGTMVAANPVWDMSVTWMPREKVWAECSEPVKDQGRTMNFKYPALASMASISPDMLLEAMETGEPYPIKAMFMMQNNAIACMGAAPQRILPALQKMDFNVVVDLFLTPTALACADVLLPAACFAERIGITGHQPYALGAIAQAVEPQGECKSDQRIIYETGSRFTTDDYKQWDDEQGFYDYLLRNTGYTYEEMRERTWAYPEFEYNKQEKGMLRHDGSVGFATSTGRYNFYCPEMLHFGLSPLADYEEPPESPVSTPELFEEYPYVLTTGARTWEYFHSEERMVPRLRESHPDPLVDLHPDTAAKIGVTEGDWIWVENMRGKCKQRVRFNASLKLDTVRAEHGWWFPEQEGAEPNLFGVFDSNINNLTVQGVTGPTLYGAPYANQICKIYPVTKENDCSPSEIVTREGGF
mgnify:CR=1 FL=1